MIERFLVMTMVLIAGVGAGATAWRAIAALTGGAWAASFDRSWRRLAWSLVPGAVLATACVACSGAIFPMEAHIAIPWLIARTVLVFALWNASAVFASRMPGPALIAWAFGCLLFAVDWLMAPQTPWSSTVIGMTLATGQLALAFAASVAIYSAEGGLGARERATNTAGLIVCLALGWAYLAGVDYLTAWIADLPDESRWYLPRTQGPWAALIVAATALHVILPVIALLPARWREHRSGLRLATVSMVMGEACHVAWMVLP